MKKLLFFLIAMVFLSCEKPDTCEYGYFKIELNPWHTEDSYQGPYPNRINENIKSYLIFKIPVGTLVHEEVIADDRFCIVFPHYYRIELYGKPGYHTYIMTGCDTIFYNKL